MAATPQLSLCLIARDSAKTLPACLASIRPWVDEIVVVDTGSQDATREIALQFGARLVEFPWQDDFSAARNVSLSHGRGQWLLWMDSDDTIDKSNGRKLRQLTLTQHPAEVLGFVMQVHCPGPGIDGEQDCTVVDHVKLIRNRPELRFSGRIHEQVLPAIRRLGGDVAWTDLYVVHSGSDQSPEGRTRKLERDLRILHLELQERPEHTFTLFNLGMTYADQEDYSQAIDYLNRSIASAGPGETHLRKAYALLANAYFQMQQLDDATKTCEAGRTLFPDDQELLFRAAMLAQHFGQLDGAERMYLELLTRERPRHFSSLDRSITGYKARHNLAAVYADLGRNDLAEVQWRTILREMPEYRLGWKGLLETLLAQKRWQTAALEIEHLLSSPKLLAIGLLMRAKWAELQGDLESAQQDLQTAINHEPARPDVRESLCRFLFEHGHPAEARSALQQLALLLRQDGSVFHNLGAINMRLGDYCSAVDAYQESLRLRPDSAHTMHELRAAIAARMASDAGSSTEE